MPWSILVSSRLAAMLLLRCAFKQLHARHFEVSRQSMGIRLTQWPANIDDRVRMAVTANEPSLFADECKSPAQMKLANTFARYAGMAAVKEMPAGPAWNPLSSD